MTEAEQSDPTRCVEPVMTTPWPRWLPVVYTVLLWGLGLLGWAVLGLWPGPGGLIVWTLGMLAGGWVLEWRRRIQVRRQVESRTSVPKGTAR